MSITPWYLVVAGDCHYLKQPAKHLDQHLCP